MIVCKLCGLKPTHANYLNDDGTCAACINTRNPRILARAARGDIPECFVPTREGYQRLALYAVELLARIDKEKP